MTTPRSLIHLFTPLALLIVATCTTRADDKKPEAAATAAVTQGQKIATCGHSFHYFMPAILKDLAKAGKIEGHEQVGESYIGGSRIIQHWDVAAEKNKVRDLLKAGKVDVLTLAPIHLPDVGIENFAILAVENNPNIRIFIQENWLPFDIYDVTFKERPKTVDHNAPTAEQLKKLHEPYFAGLEEHVRDLNKKLKRDALFVTPVGQAVIALREKVIAGQAPGIKMQEDLFTDAIGHAKPPIMLLNAYCHYAVIYRQSPVGLPVPEVLKGAKLGDDTEKLNTLLQELAWDAVTHNPLSGVKAEK